MKANRKYKDSEEAVSAVIGVILMVAITVAIAATVYVYVSGMIGGGGESTPTIACSPDNANNRLTVVSGDSDVSWTDINISVQYGSTTSYNDSSGMVTAGDTIDLAYYLEGTTPTADRVNVTLRYNPTNSLIGKWTVS